MALVILPRGNEQTFTSANNFAANSTVGGATVVRIVNISSTVAAVVTSNVVAGNIFSSDLSFTGQLGYSANLTVLPLQEVIIQKLANNTLTASSANLLGVAIGFTH